MDPFDRILSQYQYKGVNAKAPVPNAPSAPPPKTPHPHPVFHSFNSSYGRDRPYRGKIPTLSSNVQPR